MKVSGMVARLDPYADAWRLRIGKCTSVHGWRTLSELDTYLAEHGLRRIPAPKSLDWRVMPTEYPIVEV